MKWDIYVGYKVNFGIQILQQVKQTFHLTYEMIFTPDRMLEHMNICSPEKVI